MENINTQEKEVEIKRDTRKIIFEKLENLQRNPKTLKKFFPFTMEDFYDDPEGCIEVIEDYIDIHKDKIIDFEFESWIDESSMAPVLMMKMTLVPTISSYLSNIGYLNNLLPSSVESDIIREEITNIISEYQWEFNDEKTRSHLSDRLKFKLNLDDIIDKTTPEDVDNNRYSFFVVKDDKELELNEYLDYIKSKKRFE